MHYHYLECNNLPAENYAARLEQANLANKNNISNFVKKQILKINEKIQIKNYFN